MDLFDLIVLTITLLMAGFVVLWWWFPSVRAWMEAPKYRILTWPTAVTREPKPPAEKAGLLP